MRVKEESQKAGLKLNIEKTKIMAFGPITSWQIGGETVETVTRQGQLSNVIDPKYHDLCILLNVNSVLKTMPMLIIL